MGENFKNREGASEEDKSVEDTLKQMTEEELWQESARVFKERAPFDPPSEEENRLTMEIERRKHEKKVAAGRKGLEAKKKKEQESGQQENKKEKALPRKSQPTEKQVALLEKYNIDTKNITKAVASRMIDFILKGNSADYGAKDVFGRAALLIEYKQLWDGKRVRDLENNTAGVVEYIIPRTPEDIRHIRETNKFLDERHIERDWGDAVNPFEAMVKWDDRKARSARALGALEAIE